MLMMTKADSISVLVVEDHHITRAGIKLALQQERRFDVVGDACDGRTAVEKALQLRPQVVLMDIGLPDMDGLEATWRIKKQLPLARVIVITSHDGDDDISAALGVGADGYCLKDIAAVDLINGIDTVNSGTSWLDPRIAQRMRSKQAVDKQNTSGRARLLSAREQGILRLLEQGLDTNSIARQMSLPDAFRQAVAAGSAALLSPGTGLCTPEDVTELSGQVQITTLP